MIKQKKRSERSLLKRAWRHVCGPVKKIQRCDCGATAIEYAIIAALVSIAILGGVTSLGDGVSSMFNVINQAIN